MAVVDHYDEKHHAGPSGKQEDRFGVCKEAQQLPILQH